MIRRPEIIGENWFNIPHPLTPEEFSGRVVLVDFFTYSCVNCLRTIPHLKEWWERYKHLPFFIIGVHTPEFDFEKDPAKVQRALHELGIAWPIVLDNEFINWHNFANHYWPAKYLFDQNGRLVHEHYGEGNYVQMETEIQKALKDLGIKDFPPIKLAEEGRGGVCIIPTPELYCGYFRGRIANSEGYHEDHLGHYIAPTELPQDMIALQGDFDAKPEYIESFDGSTILLNFNATEVNLVIEPAFDKLAVIELSLDGKPLPEETMGTDVDAGDVIITESRMYNLIKSMKPLSGVLSIQAKKSNFKAYAFTFSGTCA